MNKNVLAGMLVALPGAIMAQTAIDAYSISQNDLRGSARFMSMGGAFTALGGDISTLNQNPGGIGVYRSSDLSATLDITMQSSKFRAGGFRIPKTILMSDVIVSATSVLSTSVQTPPCHSSTGVQAIRVLRHLTAAIVAVWAR